MKPKPLKQAAMKTLPSHGPKPSRIKGAIGKSSWLAGALLGALASHADAPMETGSFVHHPGIRIELVAAEPDLVDPVALSFDAAGLMYVVEMRDYPYGKGPTGSPGGSVRVLRFDDTGQLAESHLFAEGLSFPTSIACLGDGIVVAAKDLIYLADTDGDHRADLRQVLVKGFDQGVTDSNFSGLRWGLDNHLHGVNGGNDGDLVTPWHMSSALSLEDADFAWHPTRHTLERTYHTGGGFGLIIDDWGRSFTPHNINHMLQRILPVRAMERFNGFPMVEATVSISDHGDMARIYPVSAAETRVNHPEQAGFFSSSGGMGLIPSTFASDVPGLGVLVCDVVGNLVHRDVMTGSGPVMTASRAPEESMTEFIASRDPHFRPVGLEQGPDGNLYLIDMQRAVIEHPDYIPDKIRHRYSIRGGQDRGRIYRVRPASGTAHQPVKVAQANPESQIALLDHPTAWIRRTAQQRLVEAGDHATEAALSLALKQHGPKGRMHAMWTLEGLGLLTAAQWTEALKDEHPGVRVQALNLIEGRAQWWNLCWPLIQNLARDPDPSVRFHAALLLGKHPHPDNLSALKALWLQDWSDQWARRAILSSLREHPGNFLLSLLETGPEGDSNAEPWHTALRDIAFMVGARIDGATMTSTLGCLDRLSQILKQGYGDRVQGILEGLSEGLKLAGRNASLGEAIYPALESLLITDDLAVRRSIWQISRIMGLESLPGFDQAHQEAILMASNPKADIEARLMALELLSLANFDRSGPTFLACLNGLEPLKLQQKALELLRQYKEIEVAQEVIMRWREIGPGLRPQVIGLLLARRPFHLPLIDAIESGTLSLGELNLDLEQRRLLLRYSSEAVRTRAARWLGDEEYSHRRANLDDRVAAMPAAGRAQEGASLFSTHCASCHRSGSLGHAVGPDLSDLSHRSVEDLAYNILDPNMAIHPDYIAYEAETAEGELITGIPSAQSEESVTLIMAQGVKRTLAREQLVEFRSGGLSLMPEGFDEQLTAVQLRDLIAFLQPER